MSKNREASLDKKFNKLVRIVKSKKSLNEMTMADVVSLKSALNTIHNIATLKTTYLLLDRLAELFPEVNDNKESIRDTIKEKSENANGYDIEYHGKKISFVAEVKCCIPISNGVKFGAQQENGIKKDLSNLRNGKTKSSLCKDKKSLEGYYKFLGVYNNEEGKVATAMDNLCRNEKGISFHVPKKPDEDTIYIVMLGDDKK